MKNLLQHLREGDPRTLGKTDEVVRIMRNNQKAFDEVFEGLFDEEYLVRLRAVNAIEKVARSQREWLLPHKKKLLKSFSFFTKQPDLMKMQVPPLYGYLALEKKEVGKVTDQLNRWLMTEQSTFIKVGSLQALADISQQHPWLHDEVVSIIQDEMVKGSAAIQARGRKLLKVLHKK